MLLLDIIEYIGGPMKDALANHHYHYYTTTNSNID